jgi:hypothetical protein
MAALPRRRYAEKIGKGLRRSRLTFHPSAFILQPFLDSPIKASLAQFLYTNRRPADREQEYAKLPEALGSDRSGLDSSILLLRDLAEFEAVTA